MGKKQPVRPKFACPKCGGRLSFVIATRDAPELHRQQEHWPGEGLWRQRRCVACEWRFTTREYVWPTTQKSSTKSYI